MSDYTLQICEKSPASIEIVWNVKEFFKIDDSNGISPGIKFAGFDCFITVDLKESACVSFSVVCQSNNSPSPQVFCEMAVRMSEGTVYKIPKRNEVVASDGTIVACEIPWFEFMDKKDSFAPGGVLTLVCTLSTAKNVGDGSSTEKKGDSSQSTSEKGGTSVDARGTSDENRSDSYGELQIGVISPSRTEITWIVKDFFNLPCDLTQGVVSRRFPFPGGRAFFGLHPYGTHQKKGLIQLAVAILFDEDKSRGAPQVYCEVALKTADGALYDSMPDEYNDQMGEVGCVFRRYFRLKDVVQKNDSLVPGGILTVVTKLGHERKAVEGASALEKGADSGGSDQTELSADLLHALKKLSLVGEDRDITIRIKGLEFRTYMSILVARAPVFASEVSDKMEESETNIVDMSDVCSLATFRAFLGFINTGKVDEHLTTDAVFELYVMADKYNLDPLKQLCIESRKRVEPFILAA